MRQDQTGKIWFRNEMVGYVEGDKLFGIKPQREKEIKIKN